MKGLVGNGLTSYGVKQLVQKIKTAAREFANDDPEFLAMVEKAFQGEARTVSRRFAAKQKLNGTWQAAAKWRRWLETKRRTITGTKTK